MNDKQEKKSDSYTPMVWEPISKWEPISNWEYFKEDKQDEQAK